MNVPIVKHEHVIINHSIESNMIEMHNFHPALCTSLLKQLDTFCSKRTN